MGKRVPKRLTAVLRRIECLDAAMLSFLAEKPSETANNKPV